ncbi:ABC transporter substrate-binding protein [Leclercia adecarboxylata]|uniref:ABC transporter substrate-binding protein n=1 Tax=Leclercia adecarboxylata TaxID=83655 RepID=UPI002949158B|nr:ABC transporter substrate-binding protein [Leclercia adecarboxylata]MDV5237929.1 ABC transporter substrate-binding protein [Leclercia adecarboxylata]MDV5278792.1 ABC transporter substrate-binding protein [Leclercia adecarboxylata]MDV5462948.1 ABC transporter substrate-binding protein [Leclercia adecarboxylata]MDV5501904.1 ABC transporter substrate-binding protein [Leclercia adecarboxylata]MDV5531147.1 ABC transporter substrate-binding protein [Leclercia adecarboxylata]
MTLKKLIAAAGGLALLLSPLLAQAQSWPVTVKDLDNRTVTVEHEPQRIILQDGRDIFALALLERDNPFAKVVAWNNLPKKQDTETWNVLKRKWPEAEKILDMKFSDQGNVDLETVISRQPDLMIAQLRAKPSLVQTGVLAKLDALHIPVIFVDYELHPVENTLPSIALLGKVMGQTGRAQAYMDFYQQRLDRIHQRLATTSKKPLVFIEPIAGVGGLDNGCCFTHARNGWGGLVEAAGGTNIGSQLLPGATGNIAVEKIISLNPDYYLMTGSRRPGKGTAIIPFGYNVPADDVTAAFNALLSRQGVSSIPAVAQGHTGALYHHFYNNPYNIVAIETLSKIFYPTLFNDVDPVADYQRIIKDFTQIPDDNIILSYTPSH